MGLHYDKSAAWPPAQGPMDDPLMTVAPTPSDSISRASKVPLYYQLYLLLRKQIRDGVWQPEEMLPTEAELGESYDLSRSTVRQALDIMVNDGLIHRRRGRGTFVAKPTIEQSLSRIVSFWEDMQRRGLKPGTKVISSELMPAPEDVAEELDIEPGEELATLERLRLADDEPMSVEHSHLVHRHCQGIMEQDYANHSLRQMLETQYGIRIVSAKEKIRAVPATRTLAGFLDVDVNAPLLQIERVSYTDRNLPIEFLRIYHRGDRYTLYTERKD